MIARKDAEDEETRNGVSLFFINWWSEHYQKPFKDPTLMEYTLEELMYEYYYKYEKQEFAKRRREEDDKIEEDRKWEADQAWADKLEAEEEAAAQKNEQKPVDPVVDPQNVEWMQKQIELDKQQNPDSTFGDDISMSFEDEG